MPRDVHLTVKITRQEREQVKRLAAADDVPASTYVRHLLRDAFERRFGAKTRKAARS